MKYKIKLGDKVRDKITGYTGIVTARTEFINGCIQYTVARKLKPEQDINPTGDPGIDETCLEIIKARAVDSKEYEREDNEEDEISSGGPVKFMKKMRGY